MTTMDALWREDATLDESIEAYQEAINTGTAWRLEGHVGRVAADLIEQGYCTLGETSHRDYYGNTVPSRHDVQPGTKGSASYVEACSAVREVDADA